MKLPVKPRYRWSGDCWKLTEGFSPAIYPLVLT